jgi:hypothetical protein
MSSGQLSTAGIDALVGAVEARAAAPAAGSVLLDAYGGRHQSHPQGSRPAFVHRDASFSLQYIAGWSPASGDAGRAGRVVVASEHLCDDAPYVSGLAYQNYIDRDLPRWGLAYYGSNYARLRQVKRQYDPHNVFRFAQSIVASRPHTEAVILDFSTVRGLRARGRRLAPREARARLPHCVRFGAGTTSRRCLRDPAADESVRALASTNTTAQPRLEELLPGAARPSKIGGAALHRRGGCGTLPRYPLSAASVPQDRRSTSFSRASLVRAASLGELEAQDGQGELGFGRPSRAPGQGLCDRGPSRPLLDFAYGPPPACTCRDRSPRARRRNNRFAAASW